MIKVALYARYSSEINATRRLRISCGCAVSMPRSRAGRLSTGYTDRAISGASLLRPGIQELIQDATRGRFAIVFAEGHGPPQPGPGGYRRPF
jgi:DNA invertase Pin-like site-specific DNA recombinase